MSCCLFCQCDYVIHKLSVITPHLSLNQSVFLPIQIFKSSFKSFWYKMFRKYFQFSQQIHKCSSYHINCDLFKEFIVYHVLMVIPKNNDFTILCQQVVDILSGELLQNKVSKMEGWSSERSTILSMMLDEVTGTSEIVAIRQDFCRIFDCIASISVNDNLYFTGSKAEGLELPGSDRDYMLDINKISKVKVVQSLRECILVDPSGINVFLLCTENTSPCFSTLQFTKYTKDPFYSLALSSSKKLNGVLHLSGSLLVDQTTSRLQSLSQRGTYTRQGPSMEYWTEYDDGPESGTDRVMTIHCPFWPNSALDWIRRPRKFDWPRACDISSIVGFGCHLVPVGHPLSPHKDMEWRISFSVAERTLVWSFNHVQIQCYAVMKLILKEFIKVRCSPKNYVLCSYFIKTFLFWQYESKELAFWRENNLKECISYLLREFSKCLREGEIRHYFFPRFNLLSIKLTREAQIELLQLFDIIIQSDIGIMKECRTLRSVWSKFLTTDGDIHNITRNMQRTNLLRNDECMMEKFKYFESVQSIEEVSVHNKDIMKQLRLTPCKTELRSLVSKSLLFRGNLFRFPALQCSGNKSTYSVHRIVNKCVSSLDISTCKLWYAMMLLGKEEYASCLKIVNEVLSIIPPFAMYMSGNVNVSSQEAKCLYTDMYFDSEDSATQKARTAWLFNMTFSRDGMRYYKDILPLAIQIEIRFADHSVDISPFTVSYYLMFLCYHELCQYENRDCALDQLVNIVKDRSPYRREHNASKRHSLNITGHCLLMAGETHRARDVFLWSYFFTKTYPPYDKYNAAAHYLECFSQL